MSAGVIRDERRFRRFLAQGRAVLPENCSGPADMRTARELIGERVAQLIAEEHGVNLDPRIQAMREKARR